jgi:type VI secretion system protein ImpA
MASPSLLEFETLVLPIPGDRPAGAPVGFDLRDKLDELRKEDNPDDYAPDDPMRPDTLKKADWSGIIRMCKETLTSKSKDLLITARLTEALVRQNGFAGLRDGIHLIRMLVEQGWDRLLPAVESPEDMDLRAAPFNWLDDPDRGSRFPTTVRSVPMLAADNGAAYGWAEWKQSQDGKGKVTRDQFQKAIQTTPAERCQSTLADLNQSLEDLQKLSGVLNEKMGTVAPGLIGLRQAIEDCRLLAQQIVKIKAPVGGAADGAAASDGGGALHPAGVASSREAAYRQLAQAAAVLQQLEPHSPIPYLIQRAVALGALPFPDMIRALIREPNVLAELNRELGIAAAEKAGEAASNES